MEESPVTQLEIDHQSRLAECRRVALRAAHAEGLNEDVSARVAIAASELATNLLKYSQRGVLQIARLAERGRPGVELVAIDHGPGIPDVEFSMLDGQTTGSSSGTGLGAVRRLSNEFDIYSRISRGTVVVSKIYQDSGSAGSGFALGVTMRPVSGEMVCGDAWGTRSGDGWEMLIVADGLGHGAFAAEASAAAVAAFQKTQEDSPVELVQIIHAALRGTRGAAVAVARLDPEHGEVRFAGLGNIAGFIVSPIKTQGMVSHNGTAGHEMRHVREFSYPWENGSAVIMHSDGLSANWDLSAYPGLLQRHVSLLSGVLYRDAARDRDDACVVVGKRQ